MSKNVVVIIILSLCFYYVKSNGACAKILRYKGYTTAMESATLEHDLDSHLTEDRCAMAEKFSIDLFKDPEALMCAKYITTFLRKNKAEFYHARELCKVKKNVYRELLKCKSLKRFDSCIYTNMPSILTSLAEDTDFKACKYCNEQSFLRKCAKKGSLNYKCPRVYFRMKMKPRDVQLACQQCHVNHGSKYTRFPHGPRSFAIKTTDTPTPQPHSKTTLEAVVTKTTAEGRITTSRKVCKKGKFGENCLESCHCADNATCDSQTGRCPKNCHHRYYGMFCDKTCPDGLYLKRHGKCNGECVCTNVDQCEVTSAKCLDGKCIKGYVEMFKICFIRDYREAGFATVPFIEYSSSKKKGKITLSKVIFIVVGVAIAMALLFVIFAAIYSQYRPDTPDKKPDANEESLMEFYQRVTKDNNQGIPISRDKFGLSTSFGSPCKRNSSGRRKRRRNTNTS